MSKMTKGRHAVMVSRSKMRWEEVASSGHSANVKFLQAANQGGNIFKRTVFCQSKLSRGLFSLVRQLSIVDMGSVPSDLPHGWNTNEDPTSCHSFLPQPTNVVLARSQISIFPRFLRG